MAMPLERREEEDDRWDADEAPAQVLHIPPHILAQIHERMNADEDSEEEFGGGDEPPVYEQPLYVNRHPLLNLDFWLILATVFCLIAATNAQVTVDQMINLLYVGICLGILAIVFNLTRDRLPLMIVKRPLRLTITFGQPKWPDFGSKAPVRNLRELQEAHGVRPVDYE